MIRILLVRPNGGGGQLPNGILYLSSYLERHGYDTVVRDLTFDSISDDIWAEIRSGDIPVVGISMLSDKRKQAYELVSRVKSANPDAKVVVGGMHSTSMPKLLVDNLPIDAAVIGEGEATMKELADYWIRGIGNLKDIRGVATRKHGIHEPRDLIEDLDSLPFPNYVKVNMDNYYSVMARNRPSEVVNGVRIADARYANIITSRGCRGRCKFCSCFVHWKYRTRFRSAKNILDEMEYLYRKRGIRLFQLADDSFGQDRETAIEMCRGIIDRGMRVAWHTDMRVDAADPELLEWMSRSGCFCVAYGFESGSQSILDNLGKGITVDQIREATRLTKDAGIRVYALLMIGNLGETDETVAETIKLMNEIQPDIFSTVGYVMLCPGTAYYDIMRGEGRIDDGYWVRAEDGLPKFIHGFTESDLKRWYGMMMTRVKNRW